MKLIYTCSLVLGLALSASAQRAGSKPGRLVAGKAEVRGGEIYYEALGSGDAVVLIHGGFGDRRMWDEQFHVLGRQFRVVRYDHRGFGKSAAPAQSYSPVDDLLRLLDHLRIGRAHLVGNSMGGGLALDFTLSHPDRVASLVMVASGPNGYPVPDADREKVIAVFRAAEAQGPARAAELWLAHPMVGVTSRDRRQGKLLRAMVSENSSVFRMEHWPSEALNPPAVKRLSEVEAPALVVVGDRDTGLVREMADAAAKGIRGARKVVIGGADHLPQLTHPAQFNRILLRFLRDSRAARRLTRPAADKN